jgi:hypothetical protein
MTPDMKSYYADPTYTLFNYHATLTGLRPSTSYVYYVGSASNGNYIYIHFLFYLRNDDMSMVLFDDAALGSSRIINTQYNGINRQAIEYIYIYIYIGKQKNKKCTGLTRKIIEGRRLVSYTRHLVWSFIFVRDRKNKLKSY